MAIGQPNNAPAQTDMTICFKIVLSVHASKNPPVITVTHMSILNNVLIYSVNKRMLRTHQPLKHPKQQEYCVLTIIARLLQESEI